MAWLISRLFGQDETKPSTEHSSKNEKTFGCGKLIAFSASSLAFDWEHRCSLTRQKRLICFKSILRTPDLEMREGVKEQSVRNNEAAGKASSIVTIEESSLIG
jgi:hypothetical protein